MLPPATDLFCPLPAFRQRAPALRRVVTQVLLGASANLGTAAALAQPADVEEVIIQESQQGRYLLESSSIGKFTESLLDTPQSVTTLSA